MLHLTDIMISNAMEQGNIPVHIVDNLVKESNQDSFVFFKEIITEGWLDRDRAGRILGSAIKKTYINLDKTLIQQELLTNLPKHEAEKHHVMPLYKVGNTITVAMTRPDDSLAIKEVEHIMMAPISAMFTLPDEIDTAISINYQNNTDIDNLLNSVDFSKYRTNKDDEKLISLASSKEVVEISDAIILYALKERASDIHIEPKKNHTLIRMRTDGIVLDKITLSKDHHRPLIARFKVMAEMDIIEKRVPLDGRMEYALPVKNIDMRVSTLPTLHGEKMVIRLLNSVFNQVELDIDKINLSIDLLLQVKKILRNPHGLFIVSGPTGSGKTTTLHSVINYINQPHVNIVAIEDPIEYENPRINQVAVNTKLGLGFHTVLRSVLRQDPDVIFVGETRDTETAITTAKAALTGHLALTTLHTNDSVQAILRLQEMGVEGHILAPALLGVLSQRLARRICTYCKESFTPDTETIKEYFSFHDGDAIPDLFHGVGCEKCHNSGYSGRIAIHELLVVTPEIRDSIINNDSYSTIKKKITAMGFKDMRYDGFKKVLRGLTTLDEVIRLTIMDNI